MVKLNLQIAAAAAVAASALVTAQGATDNVDSTNEVFDSDNVEVDTMQGPLALAVFNFLPGDSSTQQLRGFDDSCNVTEVIDCLIDDTVGILDVNATQCSDFEPLVERMEACGVWSNCSSQVQYKSCDDFVEMIYPGNEIHSDWLNATFKVPDSVETNCTNQLRPLCVTA